MPGDRGLLQQYARYMGIALILPSSVVVGYGLGYLLDKLFGTTFLSTVFLLVGIVSGLFTTYHDLMKEERPPDA